MEDCQNEIDKAIGKYCQYCGLKAELDGRQYHEPFCNSAPSGIPSFAQLPGFPDYESYQREAKEIIALEVSDLTSLGEQAQTLAARMPALLKAAAEAAQQTYPGNKLLEDLAAIRALKNDKIEDPTCDVNILRAPIDLTVLRAEALAAQLLKEDETRQKAEEYFEKLVVKVFFGKDGLGRTEDPDGALTPLPIKPAPQRTVSAPRHDFIGALYKPYMSPI